MKRRDLVTTGALAGLAGAALPVGAVGQGERSNQETGERLREIRDAMRRQFDVGAEVSAIRTQQKVFLKSSGKFPDFIDIGIDVWEQVYDWHVRYQQPLTITRMGDGRYGMAFAQTTLVLRPDTTGNFVGFAYDNK